MSFSKIRIVLQREYMTRVRSKSFILSTLLTPIGFVVMFGIIIWVSISSPEPEKTVGIIDNTEVLMPRFADLDPDRYIDVSDMLIDTVKARVIAGELDAYLLLNEEHLNLEAEADFVYGGSGGLSFLEVVEDDFREVIREELLARAQVSDDIRRIFESRPQLENIKLTETGEEEEDNTGASAAFGFVLGLLIFIGLFGYGALLMRSVIEEKTNRIVEVIASSVKPIELMFGKLFGICLLAMTQFAAWFIIYTGLSIAAAPVAGLIVEAQTQNLPEEAAAQASSFDPSSLDALVFDPIIFVYFFVFFILGFLIYASVFAAVGAAVDSEQDTQQFMVPIMIPIFLAYFFNTRVMIDPDSSLSVAASIFPLTSPINMITRIAVTDVPFWQILASVVLMAGTFVGMMWLAAKIYRVGILMYGKKPSFGEMAKWIRQN
jgi:ABC-2 type transport system permease protein